MKQSILVAYTPVLIQPMDLFFSMLNLMVITGYPLIFKKCIHDTYTLNRFYYVFWQKSYVKVTGWLSIFVYQRKMLTGDVIYGSN